MPAHRKGNAGKMKKAASLYGWKYILLVAGVVSLSGVCAEQCVVLEG